MAKADHPPGKTERKQKKSNVRWVITIFVLTILISATISFASSSLMEASGMITAFSVLLIIVFLGIIFDIIGVAVTSAEEKPFHSMAAKKVSGASECIRLLRNADKVASICNDVVGDICGIVSGAAAALITSQILISTKHLPAQMVSIGMSALVAGLTVGGKAVGKSVAIHSCTRIVFAVGKMLHWFKCIPNLLVPHRRNKNK